MECNVRFCFENIIFDREMQVSADPQAFEAVIRDLASRFGAIDDGSSPVVERDELEVRVRWETVCLDTAAVNADHQTVVVSLKARRGGYVVQNIVGEQHQRLEPPPPITVPPPLHAPEPQVPQYVAPTVAPEPEPIPEPEPEPEVAAVIKPASPDPEIETLDLGKMPPGIALPQSYQVTVCLLDQDGNPLSGLGYFWQPLQGREHMGVTGSGGEARLTTTAAGGRLSLIRSAQTGDVCRWQVTVGDLSTTQTTQGMRIRLRHLGFGDGDGDGLAHFQQRFGLSGGPPDSAARHLLARLHGDREAR